MERKLTPEETLTIKKSLHYYDEVLKKSTPRQLDMTRKELRQERRKTSELLRMFMRDTLVPFTRSRGR